MYSLANPEKPALIRQLNQDYSFLNYVHDTYARHDTLYVSAAYQGLYVFKYGATTNTFTQLGSLTTYTGAGYNHSSALTPNGKTLVFLDEVPNGLPVKIADVTNPANIQVLATTNQFAMTTPHNPFIVSNKYCFISAYEDGLQLYDISVPQSPVLAGYFDTYPLSGGNTGTWASNYNGQWGCYPFFPSGNIFALDQENGMFMLKTHLLTAGITEEQNETFDMAIYPNPVKNTLGFNIPVSLMNKEFEIEIIDLAGKQVLRRKSDELNTLKGHYKSVELKAEPGIYFLKLSSQGQNMSAKKFIIAD
jgi:hypothetical protein